MSIKETWLASLRLYRKSFPQIWHLGIVTGTAIVTTLAFNAIYKGQGPTFIITSLSISLFLSLISVYLSSLIFLKINDINDGKTISWPRATSLKFS